jgi:hypothetical protein
MWNFAQFCTHFFRFRKDPYGGSQSLASDWEFCESRLSTRRTFGHICLCVSVFTLHFYYPIRVKFNVRELHIALCIFGELRLYGSKEAWYYYYIIISVTIWIIIILLFCYILRLGSFTVRGQYLFALLLISPWFWVAISHNVWRMIASVLSRRWRKLHLNFTFLKLFFDHGWVLLSLIR